MVKENFKVQTPLSAPTPETRLKEILHHPRSWSVAAKSLKFPDLCNAEGKIPDSPNRRHRNIASGGLCAKKCFRANFSVIDALSTNLIGVEKFVFILLRMHVESLIVECGPNMIGFFPSNQSCASLILAGRTPLPRFIPGRNKPVRSNLFEHSWFSLLFITSFIPP